MSPRTPSASLVSQEIAARTEEDAPLYATWTLGVDERPCIFDCGAMTTRPDGACERHDFDLAGPLFGRGYGELDHSSSEYVTENRRRIGEHYKARGYEGVER